MKGFLKSIGKILKPAKDFMFSLLGLDKFAKSEDGQALQNSFNDVTKTMFGKTVFQTQKVKAEEEKKAKEAERKNWQTIAENTQKQNELLEELIDEIRK